MRRKPEQWLPLPSKRHSRTGLRRHRLRRESRHRRGHRTPVCTGMTAETEYGPPLQRLTPHSSLLTPHVSNTAMMPVMKIPSKVPAPPIEAMGVASRRISPSRSRSAPTFYYAEDYHQQYLAKNPGGYCGHGGTGVACPTPAQAGP